MQTAPPPSRPIGPPLMTTADVAAHLAASRRTIERLRAAGKLPKPDLHLGRSPRWRPETIRKWIDAGGKAAGRSILDPEPARRGPVLLS